MRRIRFTAVLLVLTLLLSGCAKSTEKANFDQLFEKTETALSSGNLFFRGTVVSVLHIPRQISYYEAEMAENTFYGVTVTDDYFGCMPERTITVCVLGSKENFPDRITLTKGQEYLFDVSLWVLEDETVFLLPTFYTALPEYRDGTLYISDGEETVSSGSFADYRTRLDELAAAVSYGPELVLSAARARLAAAAQRGDVAFFTERGFEQPDAALLAQTAETAAALVRRAAGTENTWKGIRELLQ